MNKKFVLFTRVFLTLISILFLIDKIYALTVIPAKVEENFMPDLEKKIIYTTIEKNPSQELNIYAEGDLAEYIKFNKKKLTGGGQFKVTLKLPHSIEKPGKHRILIVVEEKIEDEELMGTNIGTSITMKVPIDVYVPYPGKYLEISLNSQNVNVNEPVNFELEIANNGKEDINMTPQIKILSLPEQNIIETLYLKNREIKSREVIRLKKILNTTDYNPGNYKAIASIDYGKIAKAESEFRIGELLINILNYTRELIIGGFQVFDVEIVSKWNDAIDGVYAEVNINDTPTVFKTSSTSLVPWEKKTITGFFDTTNFTEKIYDANITLIYYGKNVGKSSSEMVKIKFIEKHEINIILIFIIIIVVLITIITVFLIKHFLKNEKK